MLKNLSLWHSTHEVELKYCSDCDRMAMIVNSTYEFDYNFSILAVLAYLFAAIDKGKF